MTRPGVVDTAPADCWEDAWAWPPAGSGLPPLPDNYEHRHVSHLTARRVTLPAGRPVLITRACDG